MNGHTATVSHSCVSAPVNLTRVWKFTMYRETASSVFPSQQMMASERQVISEAYAGDIIGVFDPGIFSIGDTICMPGKKFCYEGIPTFAPEHFARVRQLDTMKRKQFIRGSARSRRKVRSDLPGVQHRYGGDHRRRSACCSSTY